MTDSELIAAVQRILAGDATHVVLGDDEWQVDSINRAGDEIHIILGRPNPMGSIRLRQHITVLDINAMPAHNRRRWMTIGQDGVMRMAFPEEVTE